MESRFRTEILPLKDKLFRLALRITLNREEAEDTVQETLLKMWDRRQEWHKMASLEAMAMTICRNQALDTSRKSGRSNLSLDAERDSRESSENPHTHLEAKESGEMVRHLMDQLPEAQRSIMEMRDVEGRDFADIASIMGMNEGQVRVYLHRARGRIREALQKFF